MTPQARLSKKRAFVLVAVSLAVAAPLAGQANDQTPPPAHATGLAPQQRAQTLRPGDVVRLSIWREPDMSGDYPVDESGTVVLPRLGALNVLDYTPATLKAKLLQEYAKYLRNPSIEVIVLRRIRIIGAVYKPGIQMVDPTFTIADALALAGGATSTGQPDNIQIIRDGKVVAVNIRQDQRIADSPIRSGDEIYVPERSWISRNTAVVATMIGASVSLIIALFIRG